jgi:hypothetical protein
LWIDGEGLPEGIGDPAAFGLLLEALREVEISPELEAVVHTPPARSARGAAAPGPGGMVSVR